MELYGKKITKKDLCARTGNISQICDARQSTLSYGKSDGVRVIDVKSGGFSFTVVPSRGMDIAWAQYNGKNVSYIGKPGVTAPEYFEKDGLNFFRGFFAGLVTTCGLTYLGAACIDGGEALGVHGRISNIPAYDVGVIKEWEGDDFVIHIRGKVAESMAFFENIVLTREIKTKLGENCLHIHDSIENCGDADTPLMVLYHCNFGYPIVSEDTVLLESQKVVVHPRDEEAKKGEGSYMRFEAPTHGYQEQVFFHDFSNVDGQKGSVCLFNERLDLGAYIQFNKDQFSNFAQWKMMGVNEYAVGLEPANCTTDGRDKARERGELPMIAPGEIKEFNFTIGVADGRNAALKIIE